MQTTTQAGGEENDLDSEPAFEFLRTEESNEHTNSNSVAANPILDSSSNSFHHQPPAPKTPPHSPKPATTNAIASNHSRGSFASRTIQRTVTPKKGGGMFQKRNQSSPALAAATPPKQPIPETSNSITQLTPVPPSTPPPVSKVLREHSKHVSEDTTTRQQSESPSPGPLARQFSKFVHMMPRLKDRTDWRKQKSAETSVRPEVSPHSVDREEISISASAQQTEDHFVWSDRSLASDAPPHIEHSRRWSTTVPTATPPSELRRSSALATATTSTSPKPSPHSLFNANKSSGYQAKPLALNPSAADIHHRLSNGSLEDDNQSTKTALPISGLFAEANLPKPANGSGGSNLFENNTSRLSTGRAVVTKPDGVKRKDRVKPNSGRRARARSRVEEQNGDRVEEAASAPEHHMPEYHVPDEAVPPVEDEEPDQQIEEFSFMQNANSVHFESSDKIDYVEPQDEEDDGQTLVEGVHVDQAPHANPSPEEVEDVSDHQHSPNHLDDFVQHQMSPFFGQSNPPDAHDLQTDDALNLTDHDEPSFSTVDPQLEPMQGDALHHALVPAMNHVTTEEGHHEFGFVHDENEGGTNFEFLEPVAEAPPVPPKKPLQTPPPIPPVPSSVLTSNSLTIDSHQLPFTESTTTKGLSRVVDNSFQPQLSPERRISDQRRECEMQLAQSRQERSKQIALIQSLRQVVRDNETRQNSALMLEEFENAAALESILEQNRMAVSQAEMTLEALELRIANYERQAVDLMAEQVSILEQSIEELKSSMKSNDAGMQELATQVSRDEISWKSKEMREDSRLAGIEEACVEEKAKIEDKRQEFQRHVMEETTTSRAKRAELENQKNIVRQEIEDLLMQLDAKRAEEQAVFQSIAAVDEQIAKIQSRFEAQKSSLDRRIEANRRDQEYCQIKRTEIERQRSEWMEQRKKMEWSIEEQRKIADEYGAKQRSLANQVITLRRSQQIRKKCSKDMAQAYERLQAANSALRESTDRTQACREQQTSIERQLQILQSSQDGLRARIDHGLERLTELDKAKTVAVAGHKYKDAARIKAEMQTIQHDRDGANEEFSVLQLELSRVTQRVREGAKALQRLNQEQSDLMSARETIRYSWLKLCLKALRAQLSDAVSSDDYEFASMVQIEVDALLQDERDLQLALGIAESDSEDRESDSACRQESCTLAGIELPSAADISKAQVTQAHGHVAVMNLDQVEQRRTNLEARLEAAVGIEDYETADQLERELEALRQRQGGT
eukprot:c18772_g1_i1.p1 GENE.c18772_g1_i1~~c18772_g1_i1.p1  ORF type:complete len:1244 (+),score=277.60 c18772_g1_i1:20-3751(+)